MAPKLRLARRHRKSSNSYTLGASAPSFRHFLKETSSSSSRRETQHEPNIEKHESYVGAHVRPAILQGKEVLRNG